eukprot:5824049-Amphidinium_carterae.1
MKNPVLKLLRPLYGWACSGKIWQEHLDEVAVTKCGWKTVEGWSQTYTKQRKNGMKIMTVSVDDFLVGGPEKAHVKLGEIALVDRLLGVNHTIAPQGCTAEVKINMCNYLHQAVG